MVVIIIALLLYALWSVCVLSESGPRIAGRPTGRCGKCQYDLAGLPPTVNCPECGSFTKEMTGGWTTTDPERKARWIPTCVVFSLVVVFAYPLAELVLILSYVHDHFSVDTALRSIPNRELSFDGGCGAVLFPLLGALAFSPLTCLGKSRRSARRRFLILALAGLAATLLFWTVCQPGYS